MWYIFSHDSSTKPLTSEWSTIANDDSHLASLSLTVTQPGAYTFSSEMWLIPRTMLWVLNASASWSIKKETKRVQSPSKPAPSQQTSHNPLPLPYTLHPFLAPDSWTSPCRLLCVWLFPNDAFEVSVLILTSKVRSPTKEPRATSYDWLWYGIKANAGTQFTRETLPAIVHKISMMRYDST